MPDTSPATTPATEEALWRLEDIAGHLSAAGLPARLHHTRHSSYLTAATSTARGEVEATFDFSDRPCRRPPRPASLLLAA